MNIQHSLYFVLLVGATALSSAAIGLVLSGRTAYQQERIKNGLDPQDITGSWWWTLYRYLPVVAMPLGFWLTGKYTIQLWPTLATTTVAAVACGSMCYRTVFGTRVHDNMYYVPERGFFNSAYHFLGRVMRTEPGDIAYFIEAMVFCAGFMYEAGYRAV